MTQDAQLAAVETLERRLLTHATRKSREELNALLAEEFVEFASSGRVCSKDEIVRELLESPIFDIEIDSVRVRHVGDNAVLMTYRSWRVGEEDTATSLRTSIWQQRNNEWRLIFHQGTKAQP